MTVNTPIGKITASKEVLNEISIYCDKAVREYERMESPRRADRAQEVGGAIYDALYSVGYYTVLK